VEHNLDLLAHTGELVREGFPVLIGLSRKAFLGRMGAGSPESAKERLFGTVVANAMACERGATFFRVHDVAANREALAVAAALRRS
jgi:dihydropteroate synthase